MRADLMHSYDESLNLQQVTSGQTFPSPLQGSEVKTQVRNARQVPDDPQTIQEPSGAGSYHNKRAVGWGRKVDARYTYTRVNAKSIKAHDQKSGEQRKAWKPTERWRGIAEAQKHELGQVIKHKKGTLSVRL